MFQDLLDPVNTNRLLLIVIVGGPYPVAIKLPLKIPLLTNWFVIVTISLFVNVLLEIFKYDMLNERLGNDDNPHPDTSRYDILIDILTGNDANVIFDPNSNLPSPSGKIDGKDDIEQLYKEAVAMLVGREKTLVSKELLFAFNIFNRVGKLPIVLKKL